MDDLTELIRSEIAAHGPITYARYMALALYHPTLGYYAGGGEGHEPVGWTGDYFTSGDISPLWGVAIARQLQQMWRLLGEPKRFDVIEPGAGRGLLARDVWRYAVVRAPDWAAALRYTLVDRAAPDSPLRVARQQRLAASLETLSLPADALHWTETLAEAVPEGVVGCVVSNELVDAFPAHVVEVRDGALAEIYVDVDPMTGRLRETPGAPSSPAVAGYLESFAIPWRAFGEGWRAEVCLGAVDWMREVGNQIRQGFVLTIDYGASARRLYTAQRPRGTLAAYAHHQFGERPLARPGEQDLTTHVNFSALARVGAAVGLRVAGYTTQRAFLERLGIRAEAEALGKLRYPEADTERQTDKGQAALLRRKMLGSAVATLLQPGGLGGFRVLAQERSAPTSGRTLLGLRGATRVSRAEAYTTP